MWARQISAPWATRLMLLLSGVAGLTLFSSLVWQVGLTGLYHSLQLLGLWLLPFILLDSLSLWLHTLGWIACFRPEQRRPSVWQLCLLRQAGSAINWGTPTAALGGEVAKVLWLATSLPRAQAAASVAIDKASFLAAQVLYLSGGLLCVFGTMILPETWHGPMRLALALLALGLLGFLAGQYYGLLSRVVRCLDRHGRMPALLQRWQAPLLAFDAALTGYYAAHPWRFARATVYHGLALLFDGLQTAILLRILLSAQAPGLGRSLLVAVAVTALDQLCFFVPAGLGTLEASRYLVMTGLGATPVYGITFGLVARLHGLFWNGLGLLAWVWYRADRETPERHP